MQVYLLHLGFLIDCQPAPLLSTYIHTVFQFTNKDRYYSFLKIQYCLLLTLEGVLWFILQVISYILGYIAAMTYYNGGGGRERAHYNSYKVHLPP